MLYLQQHVKKCDASGIYKLSLTNLGTQDLKLDVKAASHHLMKPKQVFKYTIAT
eukprot:m.152761 g.152761  ORF g.152761 m.152761 type:complete len:54 (-) comp15056_c0_seq2:174-335(-)